MKDSDSYENLEEVYKDLPNLIKEVCKEKGITPEQLGIDISKDHLEKTIYDINPQAREKFFNIKAIVKCSKCGKDAEGYIVLDRKDLKLVDTSGFMIFDEPMCSRCVNK